MQAEFRQIAEDRIKLVQDTRIVPEPTGEGLADDEMKFHKRHAATRLAEFLIKEGAVSFKETPIKSYPGYPDGVYLRASVEVILPKK